jgi:hypothetical protein
MYRGAEATLAPRSLRFLNWFMVKRPVPSGRASKAWLCGRSLARIAGSNLAGGMDACLL